MPYCATQNANFKQQNRNSFFFALFEQAQTKPQPYSFDHKIRLCSLQHELNKNEFYVDKLFGGV
jgi:hypothetical protein